MKSFTESLHHIGGGIVIDIGTGDGRFVSALARAEPNKFFIGIDANVKPLEKPSMKATRKPAKGGLANSMFIQAAVEDLPEELDGVADEIHVHFPWGSLLKAVATGDPIVFANLKRIAANDCLLELVIGIDTERDGAEIRRLELPEMSPVFIHTFLIPKYTAAGFRYIDSGKLAQTDWARLETSWARKLKGNELRSVFFFLFGT